jgi:Tol biopolymer transport system component
VRCTAWSPDGKTIAAENVLLDAAKGELLGKLPGGRVVAFSPDGATLAKGGPRGSAQLIATDSQQVIHTLSGSGRLGCLAFSPNGKSLAGGASDANLRNVVIVWDLDSGQTRAVLKDGHAQRLEFVRWSDDAKLLFSGTRSELCVWDADSGELLRTLPGDCIDVSPDGKLIASRGQSLIRLRRFDDGQPVLSLLALRQQQYAALGPNGNYRASHGAEDEFRCVALTDDGHQLTLTPDEFAEKYGWRNDPGKVSSHSTILSDSQPTGTTSPTSADPPSAD